MYKSLTISSIRKESPDFKTFYFDEKDAMPIKYKAGQYLSLLYPNQQYNIRRSYSITSSPVVAEPLSIGVKRIENGLFSRYLLDEAKEGDTLLTSGAAGFFTLPDSSAPYKQLFLFAAGSGITPIFSLLKTVLYAYPSLSIVLVYSNSSPESSIYLKSIEQLALDFPRRFKVELLFSNNQNLWRARLHRDLLKQLVQKHAIAPPHKLLSYLCGPENYMRMCEYGLGQLEVPMENVRREYFTTAKVIPKIAPPDTLRHQVQVSYQGQKQRFPVQYPTTILQAGRKAGIPISFSCEIGRCGNCAAVCRQGKVWMSNNDVLTERELAKGLVLTCVGYPVGGDVVLEM